MKHILKQFTQREANNHIQFIKYAIAGCIATAVDMVTFSLCAWLLLPALSENELIVKLFHIQVPQLTDQVRSWHFVADTAIAFCFSNTTAYLIDVAWVFHPGRHSRWLEFALFFGVSITSAIIGTSLGWALIRWFGWGAAMSYIAKAGAALAINYAGRKFFVFQR
jgi:putative flippase GtrA